MNKNILILDDEVDIQEYLVETISEIYNKDTDIFKPKCGLDAIDLMKKKKINLLILDLKMPTIDGVNVIKKIMTFPEEDRPEGIIAISGAISSNQNYQTDMKIASLSKPIDIDILFNYIEQVLPRPLVDFVINEEMVDVFEEELSQVIESLSSIHTEFKKDTNNNELIRKYEQLIFGIIGTASMFEFTNLQNYLMSHSKVFRNSVESKLEKIRKKTARLMGNIIEMLNKLVDSLRDPKELDKQRLKMNAETISALKFSEEIVRSV